MAIFAHIIKHTAMRKGFVSAVCLLLVVSSCSTTEQGANAGAMFGSIIGSAIGGISGGYRGSDIGTLVGMAGGAAVGAAIGHASEKAREEKYDAYRREREERAARREHRGYDSSAGVVYSGDDSGFDPSNSGDDRIIFEPAPSSSGCGYPVAADSIHISSESIAHHPSVSLGQLQDMRHDGNCDNDLQIEIRNVGFSDADGDGAISRGEECRVAFEIMNRSSVPVYDIVPFVTDTTANRHIVISPSVRVESIAPGRGVRYSAAVVADKKLKDGGIVLKVGAARGSDSVTIKSVDINVSTRKEP